MLETERICRVAVDEKGNLLGIIGGIPGYEGHVWELHPLAVQPSRQGQGIGRALVEEFEEQVRVKGGLTITLGSDDEDNMTSLSNVDLYENPWEKIRDIRNLKNHPFEFYQKLGYVVTGVVPDANGIGKPDILMAKRVVIARSVALSGVRTVLPSERRRSASDEDLLIDWDCFAEFTLSATKCSQ